MKILSIIPARGGSKGIPLKNLVLVNKKPLLYYTVHASLNSKINRTIVSTDNERIASYARKYGAEVINRPKKLSSDRVSIEPTIEHVLDLLYRKDGYEPDILILLQNTSPLRTSSHINEAIDMFRKGKFDSVLSGFISHYLFWRKFKSFVVPINYEPSKRPNRQKMMNQFIENGAIYITKYSLFKKTRCRISGKIGFYKMPEELSIQIDNEYDLLFAEQVMEKIGKLEKN